MDSFSIAKQGDEIYYKMENMLQFASSPLSVNEVINVLGSMHRMRRGTPDFIMALVNVSVKAIEKASKPSVIRLIGLLGDIPQISDDVYKVL